MPDVNTLTIAELWEHANYYVGAVRTDDPSNLTHNARMLANLVERLSEQVSHFRPATSKIPWDDEPADNPDSVKPVTGGFKELVDRMNEPGHYDDDPDFTVEDEPKGHLPERSS